MKNDDDATFGKAGVLLGHLWMKLPECDVSLRFDEEHSAFAYDIRDKYKSLSKREWVSYLKLTCLRDSTIEAQAICIAEECKHLMREAKSKI